MSEQIYFVFLYSLLSLKNLVGRHYWKFPVKTINKKFEQFLLFDSWESMFDGYGAVFNSSTQNIYAFNGRNIFTEDSIWYDFGTYTKI